MGRPIDVVKILIILSTPFVYIWTAIQYNTTQYKTCNAPYVTGMLFVGAGMTRDYVA